MSFAGERRGAAPQLPVGWDRLERAAEDAALAVGYWKRRALEAEDELARLRHTLEELAAGRGAAAGAEGGADRLRAENAALRSRMKQAHKRIGALLKHLATLRPDA